MQDPCVRLFYANVSWYVFIRLHQILCDRLHRFYEHAQALQLEADLDAANELRIARTCIFSLPFPLPARSSFPFFIH